MWRRYATAISIADEEILWELSRRHLTRFLHTQEPFKFDVEKDGVGGTFVDFYYMVPFDIANFIDGEQIHLNPHQEQRDRRVDAALRRGGVRVERFMYKPPLSLGRKKEICDAIQSLLEGMGYREHLIKNIGKGTNLF